MANIKITELNAAGSLAANDVLPVVDISTDETKKITSTNLFRTLPDGTAAAPALAFSSDQANGIYLAGTDTVGITTGGTQRVTVDASGNVVISGDLTVQGATTTVESTTVTIDDKNIELGSVASPSNTTADGGGITLKGASDKTIKWINSTGCWTFNQPTNFNDHVRIDSSGNVGIGTSSPTTNLEINGGTNNNIVRIVSTDANANIEFADNTTTSGCQIGANGDNLKFGISGSEAMRLDSSGRLLVGTSSARTNFFNSTVTAPFQIEGAGTSDRGISVVSSAIETGRGGMLVLAHQKSGAVGGNTILSSGDQVGLITFQGSDGSEFVPAARIAAEVDGTPGSNDMPGRLVFSTTADGASSASERLRIDSSGKVGIGTSSPGTKLDILGGSDASVIVTVNGQDASSEYLGLGINAGAAVITAGGNGSTSNALVFKTAPSGTETERLRITSDGKLGLGTTSPGRQLTLSHASQAEIGLLSGADTSGALIYQNASEQKLLVANRESDGHIAFQTGGANERLRIDSSGRLGIGTTSPSAHVESEGNVSSTTQFSGFQGLRVQNANGSAFGVTADINFVAGTSSGNRGAAIGVEYMSGSKNDLYFATSGGSVTSTDTLTERMRIDSSGNVGINQVPTRELSLHSPNNNNALIHFTNDDTGETASDGALVGIDGNEDLNINNQESGKNVIFRNNGERMRIDSSGNLGIGTSSPTTPLQVHSSTTASTIRITNSTSGATSSDGLIIQESGNDAYIWNKENSFISFGTNNAERMRIDSSGNVGIGSGANIQLTASGRKTLALNGNSENVISFSHSDTLAAFFYTSSTEFRMQSEISVPLVFRPNNSEAMRLDTSGRLGIGVTTMAGGSSSVTILRNSALRWADSNGTQRADIYGDSSSNLVFRNGTGSTERMRIDSSGNVSIGTTSGSFSQFGSNTGGLAVEDVGGTNTGIKIGDGTNDNYLIAAGNGSFYQSHYGSGHMIFGVGTSGTERMRIRSDGRMLVPGVYAETTGGAENVNVQSDGLMQRSVSSIKYKKDVETLEDSYADALLDLRPVWYKSKCASDNPDWGYWGFIAEELAEIDPRLVIWKTEEVTADEDGNQVKTACDPEPEGVQYSRFVPHLLNLIKRQQTAIETLETKVAALEAG